MDRMDYRKNGSATALLKIIGLGCLLSILAPGCGGADHAPERATWNQNAPTISDEDRQGHIAAHGLTPLVPLHQWTFDDGTAQDSIGNAHGTLYGGASISNGKLIVSANQYMKTSSLSENISARTLVAWVSLGMLGQGGGTALTIENSSSNSGTNYFDAIVYAERTPNQWMAGSDWFYRSPVNNGGVAETQSRPAQVMIAIVYAANGSITLYRNGVLYAGPYTQGALQTYLAGASNVILGKRHSTCGGSNCWLTGEIDEARIYGTALTPAELQSLSTDPGATCPASAPSPTLTINGPSQMLLECGLSTYTDPGAVAQDGCGNVLEVHRYNSGQDIYGPGPNTSAEGTYSVQYLAQDAHGRTVSAFRTVQVDDRTPPTLQLLGSSSMTHTCGSQWVDPGVTALDACYGNVAPTVRKVGEVNGWVPGVYTVRYELTDSRGNVAQSVQRTVQVANCPW